MAFFDNNKHYPNRKDRRKQYRKLAKRADRSCRNHGDCPWCQGNRHHTTRRRKQQSQQSLKEYEEVNQNGITTTVPDTNN